jgi:sirohydrochlorin ferrochelatase
MQVGSLKAVGAVALIGVAVLALVGATSRAYAQTGRGLAGTVVIAHGGDSAWNARVIDAAKAAKTGGPVEVSFLMGPAAKDARFQDAVGRLEAKGVDEIVVVPMLVSSHSGHYEQIRYLAGDSVQLDDAMAHHLHIGGIERPRTRLPIRVTLAMDDSPEVAHVLTDRALALTSEPSRRALLIVGHGPNSAEDYAAWMKNLRVIADSVKARTGFRDVRVELVRDDAPAGVRAEAVLRVRELIELQRAATGREVIVVPILVSRGSVSRDKLPRDIVGTPSVYAGDTLLPHPAMSRWIEARVRNVRNTSAVAEPR